MFTVRLTRIRTLSASTKDFRFLREDGKPLAWQPGQFYRFNFTDAEGEFERSYSLCNFEEGTDAATLDLVISRVQGGRATRLLFNCQTGIIATVKGPYGRLLLPEPLPERLLLIATSVGIAPYLPMLKRLAPALAEGQQAVLLFGVRDRSEFLYRDFLLDYAARHPSLDFQLCLSREAAATAPYERLGYATQALEALAPDPAKDHALLCGNPRMIDDCWARLQALGFPHKKAIREKYEFARGAGAPKKPLTAAQKQLIAAKLARHKPTG